MRHLLCRRGAGRFLGDAIYFWLFVSATGNEGHNNAQGPAELQCRIQAFHRAIIAVSHVPLAREDSIANGKRWFRLHCKSEAEHQLTLMPSRNSMLLLVFLSFPSSNSIASTGGTPVSARRSSTTRLYSSG